MKWIKDFPIFYLSLIGLFVFGTILLTKKEKAVIKNKGMAIDSVQNHSNLADSILEKNIIITIKITD